MGNGIYIATSGAIAQDQALDVTANNIANASTPGFRASRVKFGEALTQAKGNDSIYVGVAGVSTDTSAGTLTQTQNPLDLALSGDGYFAIETPEGTRYTRAGNFTVKQDGTLSTIDGNPVLSRDGTPLVIPPGSTDITIGEDGAMRAGEQDLGVIGVFQFGADALRREGSNLYVNTREPLEPDPNTKIISGAIEGTNVNVVRGLVDIVKISRNYEALHRVIESYRQIDERAARTLGGPK
jgi:flagellar basal-body rod protein FlgF